MGVFVPDVGVGTVYKYELCSAEGILLPLKSDPFGFEAELRPSTASVVSASADFFWADGEYIGRGPAVEPRRKPDVDLRGPSRLLARARDGAS